MADVINAIGNDTTPDKLLKKRYGKLHNMIIDQFKMQKAAAFSTSTLVGDAFEESVLLQGENGITYATPSEDAFALKDAIAGKTKMASVQGSQHVIRSLVGFNAVSRSQTSEQAFKSVFDVVVGNTNDSLRKRVEIDMLYGQKALGVVQSVSVNDIVIYAKDFAPGIWAGSEGAVIEGYEPHASIYDELNGTKLGSSATITGVDLSTRTITVDTLPTGLATDDVIVFEGQYSVADTEWKTQLGLHKLTETPVASTIFGISTNFSLWAPSQYDANTGENAQLTFEKVNKATYRTMSKGFTGKQCLKVNPNTWADFLNDEAALRRNNSLSGGRVTVGANGISFVCAEGTIRIESSIYVKEGFAYLVPEDGGGAYRRIGSTDVTMRPLGGKGDATFLERVPSVSAYEMVMYDNQALYTSRPAYSLQINGIVNGT